MLPGDSVVKGGIGIKLRLGEIGTRATSDFDVAAREEDEFLDGLKDKLEKGWGTVPPSKGQARRNPDAPPRVAFTGALRRDKKAKPTGVPAEYVMQPCNVSLIFLGSRWSAVTLEVGYDELKGIDMSEVDADPADQLAAIAGALGFGELSPVPLISLELQIAQKIHAVTEPGSDRAHDLVDLQLLWHVGADPDHQLDLGLLQSLCERTFEFRQRHTWPPDEFAMPSLLQGAYDSALEEARTAPDDEEHASTEDAATDGEAGTAPGGRAVTLHDSLSDASAWLNDRINEIATFKA